VSQSAADVIRGIRSHPVEFCDKLLGFHCWSKQREIIESVRDNRRTAVRSGHGSGKTAIAARTVLWFLAAYPRSVVVTTAPTWVQVEKQLWREIAKAHELAGGFYDGTILKTELSLGPDWYAIGLSTDTPERFSGFHSAHMLLVVDEASGVKDEIFEAGEGFLTSEDARILLIGNPTQLSGQFHRAFHREASLWNRIAVSTLDTPAYTGEEVPEDVAAHLPHADWADQMAKQYGAESAMYAIRVLGEFASRSDDAVCFVGDVERAQLATFKPSGPLVVSCDVSYYGDDETVIAVRDGDRVRIAQAYTGKDTTETAGIVASVAVDALEHSEQHEAHIVIDEIGFGAGVLDVLRRDSRFHVHGFHAARAARHPDKFPLRRDEMWFNFSQRLRDDTVDLDPDAQLLEDLVAPVYSFDLRGRRKVERKEDTKKRLGRSPDRADAVLMAFDFDPSTADEERVIAASERKAFSAGVMTTRF